MRKLVLTIVLAAMTSSAWAFSPNAVKSSVKGTEILQSPVRAATPAHTRSSEEEYHEVNPVFLIPEDSKIVPHSFQYACTPDGSEVFTRWEDYGFLMVPWMIPTGVYDFLFIFESPEGKLFVAKDNVTVDSDMEIEVDPEEAFVNHIQWSPCLPDGSLPQSGSEAISTGCSAITHAGVGAPLEMFIFEVLARETDEGFRDLQKEADFWINDCTKYSAGQTMHVAKGGVQYHILLPAQGMSTQTITNDPDGFVSYSLNCPDNWDNIIGEPSPLKYPYFALEWSWADQFLLGYKEFISSPCDDIVSDVKFCRGADVAGWEFGVKPSIDIMSIMDDGVTYGIELPPMNFSDDGSEFYTLYSYQSPGDGFIGTYRYNEKEQRPYVMNQSFELPENATPIFGDAAPIVVFTRCDSQFGYSYLGRYGEIRSCDYIGQDFSIKNNGVEVWNDYIDMERFFWTEDWEPGIAYNPGTWDYDISASNLIIDGLKASTSCSMHFEDADNGSWPTLTALQFRNKNNVITDRFISPADGILQFTGGEWLAQGRVFSCTDLGEMTVEYAPFGSDDFTALDCHEVPERRFMPGFGNYYEASLGALTRPSESGWYGLKFTLVDHEGNSQVQTITPAFKIEDQSGLGIDVPFSPSRTEIKVSGNTISAPEGSQIFNILGEPSDGVMVDSGIYIVVYQSDVVKVIVH